ncbi:DUF305 domain-containing protein [Georgenia thermotolerans]|uniref:DUF305 domain-containing protein n=1 Tax=Georgenia thermotolerans TaxID=527326 RepID=UPI001D03158B|nr:DUF305 domain-containing protein [Georgenia thermotolerans]
MVDDDATPPAGTPRGMVVAAVVLLLAVAAVVGLIAGSRLAAGPQHPSTASVDAGFARDMGAHHAQAVEMSTIVRERTDDPATRSLALDIALTQQHQLGQMYGWLELWDLPQRSAEPVMAWMSDHTSHATVPETGLMPGMATRAELNQLSAAEGRDAERIFLQLMIPHHEAGVEMAEYAANKAEEPAVRHLATTMVRAQTAELTVLHDMLDERGGPLEP